MSCGELAKPVLIAANCKASDWTLIMKMHAARSAVEPRVAT